MKKMMKQVLGGLSCVIAFSFCTAGFSQSSIDGTWKFDMSQSKFSPKPYVFYTSQGWYHCVSCSPTYDIAADGADHAVTGHAFDTASATIVDPHTITTVAKKNGTALGEQTTTVSADGKTLTMKITSHPMNGSAAITTTASFKRVGIAPAGVHATSGQWQVLKAQGSDNGLLVTYKTDGDALTMTQPDGETYTAKFDGADYPAKGAYGYNAVSLKRIDANTIEETDKRDGKVTDVARMTVSGKTLTIVDNDKIDDRTSTFIARKQ